MAGCGGACGGQCSCAVRKTSDPRFFGRKADAEKVAEAMRAIQFEDSAGIAVVLTQDAYLSLVNAGRDALGN